MSVPGSGHLTTAELRVLRYLPTHLSFRQIGERLYLSRHTVKTEAISAYRKLGVNSRSDAVRQARELGILEEGGTGRDQALRGGRRYPLRSSATARSGLSGRVHAPDIGCPSTGSRYGPRRDGHIARNG